MPNAISIERTGGPEVLRLAEHDPGAPGPGQVRIRVTTAGVNFIDIYFRTGLYPRPLYEQQAGAARRRAHEGRSTTGKVLLLP